MGVGRTFAEAFAKAQLGSNSTMKNRSRTAPSAKATRAWSTGSEAAEFGFELDATHGTAIVLGERASTRVW